MNRVHTNQQLVLHMLVVDPAEHRRGAGSMLIKWGLDKADKSSLPAFLEASAMGRPLYVRWGFEPKYEEYFDGEKYGVEGGESNTAMIRAPKEST
jgi:predicted N-acetyltransferase YhbS